MTVTTLAAVLSSLLLAAPAQRTHPNAENFQINEHVSYSAEHTPEGGLAVRYQFKDQTGALLTFEHTYDYPRTIEMISRFGVPKGFYHSYMDEEASNRLEILENGLFQKEGSEVSVNLSAVAHFYSDEFARPIADFIIESLKQRGLDNRTERIALAMAFTQDIPYGVPHFEEDGVDRAGVSPPPLILLSGFGDCDSKATLFAGILRHLIDPKDILFLHRVGRQHVLTAVQDDVAPGRTTIEYGGRIFVLAEIAGPGHRAFGEVDSENQETGVVVEPYTDNVPAFHGDADYSAYDKVAFRDTYGDVSFTGAPSQEAGRDEAGQDTEQVKQEVIENPLEIRYNGNSVEVLSLKTNSRILLQCAKTLTLRSNQNLSDVRLSCDDAP